MDLNKKQMEDEIIRLSELLRISSQQAIGFSEQIAESESENEKLKGELLAANVKISNMEAAIERIEEDIIDFDNPFEAAQESLDQMTGLRIEKIVTFCKEVNRIVREKLEKQVPAQRSALNINETALADINRN